MLLQRSSTPSVTTCHLLMLSKKRALHFTSLKRTGHARTASILINILNVNKVIGDGRSPYNFAKCFLSA